jgi:hypothetical protein
MQIVQCDGISLSIIKVMKFVSSVLGRTPHPVRHDHAVLMALRLGSEMKAGPLGT